MSCYLSKNTQDIFFYTRRVLAHIYFFPGMINCVIKPDLLFTAEFDTCTSYNWHLRLAWQSNGARECVSNFNVYYFQINRERLLQRWLPPSSSVPLGGNSKVPWEKANTSISGKWNSGFGNGSPRMTSTSRRESCWVWTAAIFTTSSCSRSSTSARLWPTSRRLRQKPWRPRLNCWRPESTIRAGTDWGGERLNGNQNPIVPVLTTDFRFVKI